MKRVGGVLGALVLAFAAPAIADDEPEERESEFELPPGEAWVQEGFRVQLRFGRETLFGQTERAPAPSGVALGVEPGIRLSRHFSLSASMRYTVLSGDFVGLRWTTSADLTWHPFADGFFLAAGVGYAGLLGSKALTVEDDPLERCEGSGAVALARIGWLFPVGELFSTGPVLQLDQQWTRCRGELREEFADEPGSDFPPDPEIVERRGEGTTWRHRSFQLAWSFAWR